MGVRRHPALQQEDLAEFQQAPPGLLPAGLHALQVVQPLQGGPQAAHGGQLLPDLLLLPGQGGQLVGQPGVVLRRRPRPLPQAGPGPAQLLQGLQRLLRPAVVAQQQTEAQGVVGGHLAQIGQALGPLQGRPGLLQGHAGGQGAQLDGHLAGGLGLQGQVQGEPGGPGRPLGGPLLLLGADGPQPPVQVVDLPGGLPGLQGGRAVKELGLTHLGPGGEEIPFGRGELVQGGQGPLGLALSLPGPGQGPVVGAGHLVPQLLQQLRGGPLPV